jgi:hypothetical protein
MVGMAAWGLAWLLGAGGAPWAWGQEGKPMVDLPIKRVVMFSSGVAFFEHGGTIDGTAEVPLQFDARDINDVLKSMVVQDAGGGRITTVQYGSKDPITRTLASFRIDLTGNPSLADLLQQVRGEAVEIDAPTRIAGTIVGVERRDVPVGKDGPVVQAAFLNLLTDEGLRSVPLESVGRIRLKDERLNGELRKALEVLADAKSQDKKTVTLRCEGEGRRPVRVGYIREAPIWKTSYRLVLGQGAPLLQGWAIVENTTQTDWTDVNLTLVSGRPISFVMDLYEPLYLPRPQVQMERYASLRPRTYEQDLTREAAGLAFGAPAGPVAEAEEAQSAGRDRGAPMAAARALAAGEGRKSAAGLPGLRRQADANAAMQRDELAASVTSAAVAGELGELFQYEIAAPVRLTRGSSAMLPIVNETVQGEKVSIYNQQVQPKHPLAGLRLKNTTALHLTQGPITVFDEGAYAGDAQILDLPPGGERLISYAIDLDTEVAPTVKQEPSALISVQIRKGTVETSYKYARTTAFVVKNGATKPRQVLIEHPRQPPWEVLEPKPAETTRDHYRFRVAVEPGKSATLELREGYTQRQSVVITNLNDQQVQIFLSAPQVSEAVKRALREVVQRKLAIQAATRKRQDLERQLSVIEKEQSRLRENMAQLPRDSDLFRRYVTKLNEQEDQVERLHREITEAIREEQRLTQQLDQMLAQLDVS